MFILEARAQATLHHDQQATKAIAKAEKTFALVRHDDEPEWARFIDRAYVFGEAAHTFRDIAARQRSEARHAHAYATESLNEAKRQGRARRGALSHAARAVAHLHQGDANRAAHEALHALDLAGRVRSSRTRETIRDLYARLHRYEAEPEVGEFIERAGTEFSIAA